ncbi:hypothetical protein [Aminipila sp.]|uniref:hypothetical protein n=1 Tax=Aminipila sp. TaxID=2060095 RepID=UPI00289EB64D|nr:hypothetical protein [Aminipila sp.]
MFYKNHKQEKMKLVSLIKGTSFPSINSVIEIFSATYMKIILAVCFLFMSALFLSCISGYLYKLSDNARWAHYFSLIFFPIYVFGNVMIWKLTIQSIRNKNQSIEKQLKFLIQTNRLFTEDYCVNANGNREKYVTNSARIGYLDSEDSLIITAFKDGDNFSDSMNKLEVKLSALFRLPLSSKEDEIFYCKYVFEKNPDTRLNLSQGIPLIKGTVIPITQKISYDVSSVSHGLTIGGTGSGKSYFINWKILGYAQMGGLLHVVDP